MLRLTGKKIVDGVGDFQKRMKKFAAEFEAVAGERLFAGTVNIEVSRNVPPVHHFKLLGARIGEPDQDLWFEICRVNGVWAYRIRPYQRATGQGGWGDNIIEIAADRQLRPMLSKANAIVVELFRDS